MEAKTLIFHENQDFGRHHENLDLDRKVLKQIFWVLSVWQNFPSIFNYGLLIAPGKFLERNLEQIQVKVCKTAVCVQLQLGANFALTAKLAARGRPSTMVSAGSDS